jgi:hypothetical protein
MIKKLVASRKEYFRHQCRKTTVLSTHRCLINTVVEKMNFISIYIRILTTRCLQVRVNIGIQTILYTFKMRCSIAKKWFQSYKVLANFREGKSAASWCRQVAASVPGMFCNFYVVKNQKIANNSATTEAQNFRKKLLMFD